MSINPLTTLSVAVLLGVGGQTLGSLLRLPAIVFLLALGLLAGPFGLSLIAPASLGPGLKLLTSGFIAIILFEGSLTLHPKILREALTPAIRLITWGAAITLFGVGLLGHFIVGLPWMLAFFFASLVIVTGPTVIAPILRRVPLQPRLSAVLKAESILIDPVGVFVAVVMFEYVVGLSGDATWWSALRGFVERVVLGGTLGLAAGLIMAWLATLAFFRRRENEYLVSLGVLGGALTTYAVCEQLQPESGIMAVIVAGLVLAQADLPFRQDLEKFKDLLTTLGVSILFILLAANLDLSLLLMAGWREAALLVGLMLAVRPAAVFLSTWGTSLTWREKGYLSVLAPRGILAAAMASYFAEKLRLAGMPEASRVELLVFLTIATTVLIQGGGASLMARLLGVLSERGRGTVLVGFNEWSLALAEQLRTAGQAVFFVDDNPTHCEAARAAGFQALMADATDPDTYAGFDIVEYGQLVAMTSNDAVNALACDAALESLGEGHVLRVLGRPAEDLARTRTRLAGAWAAPSALSHTEITRLLREDEMGLVTETVQQATLIAPAMQTTAGLVVPLLVEREGRWHIAIEGQSCPVGSRLVGLARTGSPVQTRLAS